MGAAGCSMGLCLKRWRAKYMLTTWNTLMSSGSRRRPSAAKVQAYRARLRAQGLRPIQIWVPDVRSVSFVAEAHRQSLASAQSAYAEEDQACVEAISDLMNE
jgi:hypothetical protein